MVVPIEVVAERLDRASIRVTEDVYGHLMTRLRSRAAEAMCTMSTDQFISIDPAVAQTNQPYVFVNDNPLNAEDPLGLSWWNPASWTLKDWAVAGGLALGVVGAATGVGAVIEIAAGATQAGFSYGAASFLTGTAATVLDGSNCSRANRSACVGAGLGLVDIVTGLVATGGSAFAAQGSVADAVLQGVGAFSASFGFATSVFDATVIGVTPGPASTTKSKTKIKMKIKFKFRIRIKG